MYVCVPSDLIISLCLLMLTNFTMYCEVPSHN